MRTLRRLERRKFSIDWMVLGSLDMNLGHGSLESLYIAGPIILLVAAGLFLFQGRLTARLSGILAAVLFILFFWAGPAGGSPLGLLIFGPLAVLVGWLVARRVNGDYR